MKILIPSGENLGRANRPAEKAARMKECNSQ
jgi:hypothetical protein